MSYEAGWGGTYRVFHCFMLSTLVQHGPGGEPGVCLSTLRPYSGAGCADLPLALWVLGGFAVQWWVGVGGGGVGRGGAPRW
jgi:hypothetical protein